MRYLLFVLLLTACCVAQTAKPIKSRALSKCETALEMSNTDARYFETGLHGVSEENATLGKKNLELEAKNAELTKQLDEIKAAGRDVVAFAQRLQTEYKALTIVYDQMLAQLNRQTTALEERNTRAAERMAAAQEEQARINRVMSVFSVTPKPAPTINLQVTDCTKLPALCVH